MDVGYVVPVWGGRVWVCLVEWWEVECVGGDLAGVAGRGAEPAQLHSMELAPVPHDLCVAVSEAGLPAPSHRAFPRGMWLWGTACELCAMESGGPCAQALCFCCPILGLHWLRGTGVGSVGCATSPPLPPLSQHCHFSCCFYTFPPTCLSTTAAAAPPVCCHFLPASTALAHPSQHYTVPS